MQRIFNRILSESRIQEQDGRLYIEAEPERLYPALLQFAQTVANLAEVPPTVYFNVPAGYAQLVPALEADAEFAGRFFSRLRLMFNAAAALPAALRQRLEDLAVQTAGRCRSPAPGGRRRPLRR